MYEKIAWENFLKTGDIESFLEYRKLMDLNSRSNENIGEKLYETDKSKRNCN